MSTNQALIRYNLNRMLIWSYLDGDFAMTRHCTKLLRQQIAQDDASDALASHREGKELILQAVQEHDYERADDLDESLSL